MALLGTLRNKMGVWVVVFVFVAIASFVLSDLLSSGSSFFANDNEVAEIAGSSITQEEYQNTIKEQEINYELNFGRSPGEREKALLENQAWELLIARHAIQKQYEKLGIEVTTEEKWDMIQGQNVDEGLKSAPYFQSESGQFDRSKVVNYIQRLKDEPEGSEARFRWDMYERNLVPSRERIKYENLLIKTAYVTTAEAEREYHVQNDVSEIKYLYVPYHSVADSSVTLTDNDFETYYKKNKQKFKTKETRDISYVTFPVVASGQDTLEVQEKMQALTRDLRNTTNDSLFFVANSDNPNAFVKYNPGDLPPFINKDSLVEGKIIGPFFDGNTYKVAKISKVTTDTIYSAKARHILIKPAEDPSNPEKAKSDAKEKARSVLKELKAGANFESKVREYSDDKGSIPQGGDIGWVNKNSPLVPTFKDAVLGASRAGLLNDVVESEYGYHIIDVTAAKNNKAYWIGILEDEVVPGDASIHEASRKAENFQDGLSGVDEFKKRANEQGLAVQDANNITADQRRVGMLGEDRQIVRWLFNDASVGEVSDVFDMQNQFVVAVMTGKIDEGYKPLSAIKEQITLTVRNEVKGRIIADKLGKLQGTLEEIAKSYGGDANVYTSSDVKLSASSIPSIGFDPKAVGLVFSLENGKRSEPYPADNGVVVIEMQNKTVAPAIADYSNYKTQLEQAQRNQNYNVGEAIKEVVDIEDKRYKFN